MEKVLEKLPSEFIKRLKDIYPFHFSSLSLNFAQRPFISLRANFLKTDRYAVLRFFKSFPFKYQEVSWLRGAFLLPQAAKKKLEESLFYQQGAVYIQGLSSMFAALALEAKPGEVIGDFCAAPGSKTTFIAALIKRGKIIALEKQKVRFYKLLANLEKQGAESLVEAKLSDATFAFKKYPEYFDRILVDAPCSAEARFDVHNPRSWRYWSLRKIKESQRRQKRLLFSAAKALKRGGALLYSTCTFAPEENEEVIDWLLQKFGDFELERITVPFSNALPALTSFGKKKFSSTLKLACRILPNKYMEGFFLAKLRKN